MAVERDGSSRGRGVHARLIAASLLAAAAGLTFAATTAPASAVAATASTPSAAASNGAFATQWVGGRLRVVPITPGQVSTYRASGVGGYATTERGTVVRALGTNDPLRPEQWALDRVSFESAWTITQGQGVKVAVIDSGVRGDHQDLAGTVLPGIDFVSPGGNGWNDRNGHGTHVAGIIAAAANNGVGVAGGAPRVKILPVRVLAADGSGSSENVARGIVWAVDHGARVINLSLGGPDPSPGTEVAIEYANSRGVIVLAAAGNGAQQGNRPSYPAAFPETVAVGAVDSNLSRAYFSNFGSYLDIAAPGMHVLSTYGLGRNAYAYMNGTSMATPYASATAALVVAVNPALSANGIRTAIQHTAIDLGPPGPDVDFGSGLINPHAAVLQALPKPAGFGTQGHGYWVASADGSVRAAPVIRLRTSIERHDVIASARRRASASAPHA